MNFIKPDFTITRHKLSLSLQIKFKSYKDVYVCNDG